MKAHLSSHRVSFVTTVRLLDDDWAFADLLITLVPAQPELLGVASEGVAEA